MEPRLNRAVEADIAALHRIRCAVRENRLTDPSRLTEDHYRPFLAERGETWHASVNGQIAGFGALDYQDGSVWALFVDPAFEGLGLGKLLLGKLVEQARENKLNRISLVTTIGTRAEQFYLRNGWNPVGMNDNGECILTLALN